MSITDIWLGSIREIHGLKHSAFTPDTTVMNIADGKSVEGEHTSGIADNATGNSLDTKTTGTVG